MVYLNLAYIQEQFQHFCKQLLLLKFNYAKYMQIRSKYSRNNREVAAAIKGKYFSHLPICFDTRLPKWKESI